LHVTRIKVKETLAKEIDELALTYLNTAVSQLEKKYEQIAKLDTQITDLIQDPGELEEAIMDSEMVQDEFIEKINELNKRVELLSRQLSFTKSPPPQEPDKDGEATLESHQETVSKIINTSQPHDRSMHDSPVTSAVNKSSVTSVDKSTASESPVVYTSSATPICLAPNSIFIFPMLLSTPSHFSSASSVSHTSVSIVWGLLH